MHLKHSVIAQLGAKRLDKGVAIGNQDVGTSKKKNPKRKVRITNAVINWDYYKWGWSCAD